MLVNSQQTFSLKQFEIRPIELLIISGPPKLYLEIQSRAQGHLGSLSAVCSPKCKCQLVVNVNLTIPLTRSQNDPGLEIASNDEDFLVSYDL